MSTDAFSFRFQVSVFQNRHMLQLITTTTPITLTLLPFPSPYYLLIICLPHSSVSSIGEEIFVLFTAVPPSTYHTGGALLTCIA